MEVLSVASAALSSLGTLKSKRFNISSSHQHHSPHQSVARKIFWHWKREGNVDRHDSYVNYASLICSLSRKRLPHVAQEIVLEMKSEGFLPDNTTLSALMVCNANNNLFPQAQAIWDEILNSSFVPTIEVVSELFAAYCKLGHFDEVTKILHQISFRHSHLLPKIYPLAISCFGRCGNLDMMENTLKEMVSRGFLVDSATGNALMVYYSNFGSLSEMENAYGRLKRSRILIEEEGIRAISSAYIKEKKFYSLGEFLRNVGLGRRNTVDAYLDRRIGRNLDFALSKMFVGDSPMLSTDPILFEALGKGDFHSSSEVLLEFNRKKNWTYKELIAIYLKKTYRSNQIFWNY